MAWEDELKEYKAQGNVCLNAGCRKTYAEGVEFCPECGHSTTTHLEGLMYMMRDEMKRKEAK